MELCELTINEAHKGLVQKKFSSRELTLSCLQRIDKVEDKINAFITITGELAVKQADGVDAQIARGQKISPLAGIPMAFKDLFCTKGIETTAASNILRGFVPPYDATVVRKLKAAGVVVVGKANHDAFAHGSSGENSDFGPTRNPWDPSRVPGGSSRGSAAAVAAGECLFATGTDTGSSIRLPAAFCNLVGLKPTYGRVSRYGVIAMASSLDTVGCLTRNVADHALVMRVMAGHDPLDATTPNVPVPNYVKSLRAGVKGVKVGVPKEYFGNGIEGSVRKLVEDAIHRLEGLGARIVQVSLPHTGDGLATYCVTCHPEVGSNLARYDGIRFGYSYPGGKKVRDVYFKSRGAGFGMEAKRRIVLGTFALSSGYYEDFYEKAQRVRTLIKRDFEEVFEKIDVLVAPSSPTAPFKLGAKRDPLEMYLSDVLLCPANLAGVPSLNVPCGFIEDPSVRQTELPVGLQIIGPHFGEELLFRVGYAYEQTVKCCQRKPPIRGDVEDDL